MDVQRACIHPKGWTDNTLMTDWLHSAADFMAKTSIPVYIVHPQLTAVIACSFRWKNCVL